MTIAIFRVRRLLTLFFALLVLFVMAGSIQRTSAYTTNPDCTQQVISWQAGARAPAAHIEGAAAAVNGKLYVFTGFATTNLVPSNRIDVYNPATNIWESASRTFSATPIAASHIQAAADGRYVWLVGGFIGQHPGRPTNQSWRYDTVTDTWAQGPSLPARRASGAVVRHGRTLHYIGGLSDDRMTDYGDHYVLNLDNPTTWTIAPSLPNPRNHFQGVAIDNYIYAVGGQYGHDNEAQVQDLNLLHAFNVVTNQWERRTNITNSRSHAEMGTFVMNDRIMLVSGRNFTASQGETNYVSQYNPQTNIWNELTRLPVNLIGPAANVFGNRIVVTLGGVLYNSPNLNTWIGQVNTDCVTSPVPPVPVPNSPVFRINSGGSSMTTSGAVQWSADQYYTGGRSSTLSGAVAGTTDDSLYTSARTANADFGSFTYNFPVNSGYYTIRLHFAENYFTGGGSGRGPAGAGRRIFDVSIENAVVLDNYDINAAVGPLRADIRTIENIHVTDGMLNINFVASVNRPLIGAIEILNGALPSTNLPPLANAGADQTIVDSDGNGTQPVPLNGSGSSDPDGTVVSYLWQGNGASVSGQTVDATLPVGLHTITLTVTDDDGATASDTVVITVQSIPGNQPPFVNNPGAQSSAQYSVPSLPITASDPENDTLAYSATGLPAGLSINAASGVISGTITAPLGAYPITVTVTDNGSPVRSGSVSFNWNVTQSPFFILTGLTLINAGTDAEAGPLTDGTVINLYNFPGGVNVRANTTTTSGSIDFTLNGAPARLENYAPFSLYGDGANGTDFYAGTLAVGSYTLTATPYTGKNRSGTMGTPISVNFSVINEAPPQGTPAATMEVTPGGDINAGTFTDGFWLTNTSTGNLRITSLTFDLSTAILPDLAFDPVGGAGDLLGRCFTVVAGDVATGLSTPANPCSTPFSGMVGTNGYTTLTVSFANFDPGETFHFAADVDPLSIAGSPALGGSGNISGAEMTGTTVTVTFNNGSTLTGEIYRVPETQGGGRALLVSALPPAPAFAILGLETPAQTYNPNLTVRVGGVPGSSVSLLVAEAGLNGATITPPNPFVVNEALVFSEYPVIIGESGIIDVPITLIDSDPDGNLYYFTAVTNGVGGTTSATADMRVLALLPNTAPILINPGDQETQDGTTLSLPVTAIDPEGGLIFSATGLPFGLAIDPTTDTISGTIVVGVTIPFSFTVTITVIDNGALTDSVMFPWTVIPPNTPPEVFSPGDFTFEEGTTGSLQILAIDAESAVSFSATGLPDGLVIDPATGIISGTIADGTANVTPYSITITVTDAGGLTGSVTFQWTVIPRNTPPTVENPGDQNSIEGDIVNLPITASDREGEIIYSAAGLPFGLVIDAATGVISGTISPGASAITPWNTVVSATDVGGLTTSVVFQWTVMPPNTPPVITSPGDPTSIEGTTGSLPISAADAQGPVTFSGTGLPPGLTLDSATGVISGTIAAGAATGSPYSVTITVTDSEGLTASITFFWTITPNSAPTITSPGDLTSPEGASGNISISGFDAEGVVSFSATGLPPGLAIDAATGMISGTIGTGSANVAPYSVTLTVTDAGGLTASVTFNWFVTAP